MIRRGDAKNGKREDLRDRRREREREIVLNYLFFFLPIISTVTSFFLSHTGISLYLTPFLALQLYDRNRVLLGVMIGLSV